MSLPQYPVYKDTTINWLAKLPSHWDVMRLDWAASCNDDTLPETTPPDFQMTYVDIGSVSLDRGIETSESFTFQTSPSRARRLVRDGDIIVSTVRTYLKAIAPIISPLDNLVVSTGFAVIRPKDKIRPTFAKYVLQAAGFVDEIISRSTGVSYPAINASDLVRIPIPLPTLSEQIAIATFLDREISKIDTLIAAQEKLLTLLAEKRQATISHAVTKGLNPDAPMKDSGVEWLGNVPEHWNVVRLGLIFREIVEAGNDELPILSVSIHSGISDTELNDDEMERKVTRSDDSSKYKKVAPGDLAYNMMRAWQGGFGAAIVHGMVSPAYVVARPRSDFSTNLVEMILRTPLAVTEIKRYSRGITDFRLRLYWEDFKNLEIALPPREEQIQIECFINHQTSMLDRLNNEARRNIALLKERRSALISAAVTGQIDVRAIADV